MANMLHKTPPSHRLTVSSLLSPPEMKRSESFGSSIAPTFDKVSFHASTAHASAHASTAHAPAHASTAHASAHASKPHHFTPPVMSCPTALHARGAAYASPPISPCDAQSQKENIDDQDDQGARDYQLFATSTNPAPATLEPLFPQEPASHVISRHMQSPEYRRLESKPSRQDYELVVSLRATLMDSIQKDPVAWRKRERSYEAHYGHPTGVQKRPAFKKLAPAPSSRPRQPKMALARLPPRTSRVPKAKPTPPTQAYDSFDNSPATASPKPARLPTNRDDTDYSALPDYCPPLDTLPKGNPKCLKAEWKGTVLDLSNDPDRHMLHEAEIHLAATLRLNCATYLCSKRRVFQARIEALKIGKEFRKTDAQQACKIDVNKASKLWQSYDKVGWFHPDYFRQYL
ncbi:hypothetical protein ACEQ8H_000541 [Pleosporales sp. CAS-2024a]